MIEIKDYKHNVILSIEPSEGSIYYNDLMSGEYIKVRFSLAKPVILTRGTYIRNEWGWFMLCDDYKPRYDKATGGFSYDVQFDAYYYYFSGYILKYRPRFGAVETSFSLTGGIEEHWNVFIENLRYDNLNIYSGTAPCTYREFFDGWAKDNGYGETIQEYDRMLAEHDCVEIRCEIAFADEENKELGLVENVAKGISYDSVKLSDVPGLWCEDNNFKCEWWVKDNVFHFGHLGLGSGKNTLEWNLGEECEDMQRSESKEDAATRIIAFGSTRNVPSRYRKDLIFTVTDPASDYVDTFRRMKAEWFRATTREKKVTPYHSDSEDNEALLVHVSPDLDIEDCPNFTISDAKFEIKVPFVGYNTLTNELISFSENNLSSIKKLIDTSVVEVVEVVKNGDKTQEIIKGTPSFTYTYRDEEYYRHYTISVEPYTDGISAMATRLYLRFRLNNDFYGTPIPSGSIPIKEYPQIRSNKFSDNYWRIMFSGEFTNESFYRVHTTAEILTGAHKGEIIPVTLNPDTRNVTAYESGKITGLSSLSVGDTYKLDNVLTGKVKLDYFTDERASAITNYERRLMLPVSTCPNNYIESDRVKDENGKVIESKIVEVVKVYDDIYPTQELVVNTVLEWESHEQNPEDPNNPDAQIYVRHYRLLIPTSDFDFEAGFLTEDKLECQFQSGQLAGMSFSINFLGKGYGEGEQKEMLCYELDINNTYGIDLPNETFFPKKGDKIVFFGYDPSQLSTDDGNMVISAERKLEEEARKTLKKIEQDTGRYTCPLMSRYAKGLFDNSSMPEMGDPVRIYNYGYFDTFRNSRVIGMEIKLDIPWDTPKYTIGEDKAYSRSAETAQSIASLTAKIVNGIGVGGGGVSESQLKEGVEKYGKNHFLSKTSDDTANGHITFERGLTSNGDVDVNGGLSVEGNAAFGSNAGSQSFAPGFMGYGWRIDELGHAVVESLSSRRFIETPELRFNRISINTGVNWQTFGGGIIDDVFHPEGMPENEGVVKIKLEDGEYGAVAASDYCMGLFHFEGDGKGNNYTPSEGEPALVDSHNGNFAFAGSATVYFEILGICDANGSLSQPDSRNQYFRYRLRDDWTLSLEKNGIEVFNKQMTVYHPQPAMNFACYANPVNAERQSVIYSTTTYGIMLAGMVDWTYSSKNIALIWGDLRNFTIDTIDGEKALTGSGIGVGRIYRWGTEIVFDRPAQLINQQLYLAISDKQPDEFKASLSSVVWTDEAISPTKEKPYKYGYWKKTYILDGDEVISPKNNQPTAADVSLQGTYAESGESAISILYEPSNIVIVDVSTSAWNEEGEGVTAEVAADSYHRVTVKMLYGQQVESIANIVIGTAKGIVDAQVEIAADKKSAVIAFGVTKELPINQTTYLPVTYHSVHTTVGYRNDLVITTSVAGNDGQDGQQGVGIASYNGQYYANDGSPISDSTVGFITPTMAGFSAEHPCLWNKVTIINTLNEVINNPRWDVISWWGRDGQDTYRQYSVDGVNDWHKEYTDGDIYERVSTDGTNWSKAFRIVGENGAAGPYTDYSFALSVWAENNDATQCPPDLADAVWNDAPIKPTPERPYLWQRSIRYSLAGNTLVPGAPCYVRINGKDGVIGQHGISTFTTYNGQKERPERPTGNGEGNGWHRNPDDCGTPIWASQKQAVNIEDGEWSEPYKCSATDGQSVNIKDTLPNAAAIFAISNPEVNDAYIAEDTGVVYVWNGVNWVNCGKFRGEDGRDGVDGYDGVSSYLHLKYSDDGLSFTDPDGTYAKGERPAAWIGTLVDTNEEDPVADADFNRYKWVHIQGMPATTYEIITTAYVIAKDANGNAKESITMDFYKVKGENREKADCYVSVVKDGVETVRRYNKTSLTFTETELNSINTINVEMRITADGEAVDRINLSAIKDGENGNSIHIKGHKPTYQALCDEVKDPQINDAWVVDDNGCLYVYTNNNWENVGKFSGKDGEDGKDGQNVVVYAIVPSCSILSMSTDGEAADGIEFAFYKYEGSLTRVPQPMYYNIKVKYTDGHIYEETKETADPSVTIPSQKLDNCEWVLCEVWVNNADKGESTKRDAYETIYTVTDGTIPSWDELTDDQKNDLRGEDGSSSEFIYLLTKNYPFNDNWNPNRFPPSDDYKDEYVPKPEPKLVDDGTEIEWTDDPSPVSETMRYQYVAVRYKNVKKNNDRKRYWSDWSAVSLWNRYAEDGKDGVSPLVIDLANEMTSIPVDEQGQVTKEITLTLQLDAYIGTTKQTIAAVTCTPPTGVSFSTASGLATPTITFSQGYIPAEVTDFVIEASVGSEKRTVTFTVAAIKSGGQGEDAELYELAPSDSAVSFSRDENNNLLPVKGVQIQMQVKKTKGSSSSIFDIDNKSALPPFNIRYAFDDLRPTYNTGTVWPTALSHTLTITTEQALAHRSLNVAMFDSSNKLIDRETLPIVRDGNKGEDGKDGKDAIITDLTNETDTIGVGSDGVLDVATTVTTTVVVFSGQTKVQQTAAPELSGPLADVCEITQNGTDYDISIELPVGLTFEDVEAYRKTLTITPVVDGMNPSSKVFSLVGNLDAEDGEIIYLVPSVTAVKKTDTGYSVSGVSCSIWKKVGSDAPVPISNGTDGYRIYFSIDGGNENIDDGTVAEIPSSAIKSEIKFILRHGDAIIDTETIPMVADGAKGDKGDQGAKGEKGDTGATGAAGANGVNAIRVVANKGMIVMFSKNTRYLEIPVDVFNGMDRVSDFTFSTLGATSIIFGGTIYWSWNNTEGSKSYYLGMVQEFYDVKRIPFYVTYKGQRYDSEIQVAMKVDGDSPSLYEVSCSHRQIFSDPDETYYVPGSITFDFHRTIGDTRADYITGYRIIFRDDDDNEIPVTGGYGSDSTFAPAPSVTINLYDLHLPINVRTVECQMMIGDTTDNYKSLIIPFVDSMQTGPQGEQGQRGPSGVNGCVVVPCGEWKENTPYVNDEKDETKDGREIDVVLFGGQPYKRTTLAYPEIDGVTVFVKPFDNSFAVINISGNVYAYCDFGTPGAMYSNSWWTESAWDPFVAARVLLAENANIKFASGQASYYMDENNHVRIGIQAETTSKNGEEQPMIYAGADIRDVDATDNAVPANAAPYRVYKDGSVIAESFATGTNGPRMKVKNGLFHIFGEGPYANICFGVDEEGNAILQFFDANGNMKYDLGSKHGLRNIASTTYSAYFAEVKFRIYTGTISKVSASADLLRWRSTNYMTMIPETTKYRYVAGRVVGVIDSAEQAEHDGKIYDNNSFGENACPASTRTNCISILGNTEILHSSAELVSTYGYKQGDVIKDLTILGVEEPMWSHATEDDIRVINGTNMYIRYIEEVIDGVRYTRSVISMLETL